MAESDVITIEKFIEEANNLLEKNKNIKKIIIEGDKTTIVIEKDEPLEIK